MTPEHVTAVPANLPASIDPMIGRRAVAHIIDGLLIWMTAGYLFAISGWPLPNVLTCLVFIAYETYMTTQSGMTLGKRFLGLKVVSASNGKFPEQTQVIIRSVIKLIPFVPLIILVQLIIGKIGLHDEVAKTRVLKG
jgi:uncharacterized RDD family membrane protein YckC